MTRALRILLVEDDPGTGSAVQQYLEYLGHEVDLADDGASATRIAETRSPDVMVCDWKLAGNDDGVDVAGRINARHDVPVILVTGHRLALAKREARASRVRISAFRRKPVSLPDLASLIDTLAGNDGTQPA